MPVASDGKYTMSPKHGEAMAEARKRDKKKAGRTLESIRIEPAQNGFVVHCHYNYPKKKSSNGCEPSCYEPEPPRVFKSAKETAAFVGEELGA